MTDIVDPVELLNSMSPPAGWNERTDLATDARAASIFDRVVQGNVVPFRPSRRRLRIVTGVVVTVALGGVGAAALLQRDVKEDSVVACWSAAEPVPDEQFQVGWDGVADPADLCLRPWQNGTFGTDGPPAPLQSCLTPDGVVAVMPGDENTCGSVGLQPYTAPTPGLDEPDTDVNALQRMLEKKYNRGGCYTEQQALEGVRRTLEEFMFDGWATQTLGSFESAETCASVAIDRESKTVNIVSVSRSAEAPN